MIVKRNLVKVQVFSYTSNFVDIPTIAIPTVFSAIISDANKEFNANLAIAFLILTATLFPPSAVGFCLNEEGNEVSMCVQLYFI